MSMMTSQIMENKPNPASGDHELIQSESGVELKSLLKLIDNVIEMSPATDGPEDSITSDSSSLPTFSLPPSLVMPSTLQGMEHAIPGYVTLSETLLVPVKKFPKYNFVGRILGPRGMTVKQLEKETGCKIFVRGRASNTTSNPTSKANRSTPKSPNGSQTPRPSLSNISKCALTEDPLHVYIECYDLPESGAQKMANAVSIIQDLLSPPADGKDELKRQQLVDISLINGTYRATSASNEIVRQFRRAPCWRQTVDPTSNPIQDMELLDQLNMDAQIGAPSASHADLGAVYGIAQQRRVWQKPRGPDALSEEYAKSVSSREFVSDIVSKTKKSPVKNQSNDSLFHLPDNVVNQTLKVAQNLLASHKHLTFGLQDQQQKSMMDTMKRGAGDLPDFSLPPPPLHQQYHAYPEYPQMYYMYPPPPPPPQAYCPTYSRHY